MFLFLTYSYFNSIVYRKEKTAVRYILERDDAMLKDNSTNLDSINKTDFRHIIPLEKNLHI